MREVNCFGIRIALTQATSSIFYKLKKVHISLAKTSNHIKFLKRCQKYQLIPKGLQIRLPICTRKSNRIKQEMGTRLRNDLLHDLKHKLALLREEEISLRCRTFALTDMDQWEILWNYIEEISLREFQKIKIIHIKKFEALSMGKESNVNANRSTNTKTVVNLSDKNLNQTEIDLLSKGLNFVPFREQVNKLDLAAAVELSAHHGKKLNLEVCSTIREKKWWQDSNLGRDNLTILERKALKQLKEDNTICIMQADKGKAVVVMNKAEYDSKLEGIIKSDSYERCDRDPSIALDYKIHEIVRSLKKLKNDDTNWAAKLIGANGRNPAIYGAPKIHKPGIPLRPIITTYNTVLEKCNKFVANTLDFYLNRDMEHASLKNTFHLVTQLKECQLPQKYSMVSFDVINLFGSLDLTQCSDIIMECIDQDNNFETTFGLQRICFKSILNLCLNASFFQYKEEFYKQVKGVPMGASCSAQVAELYLRKIEEKVRRLPNYNSVHLWRRFKDDVLVIWTSTERSLTCFLNDVNKLDKNIKFTVEVEKEGVLPFMDIKLTNTKGRIKCTMYSKPSDSGLCLNYGSFHHPRIFTNLIKGEMKRYKTLSDNPEEDLQNLKRKLLNNHYPPGMIDNIFKKPTVPKCKENDPSESALTIPYMGKLSRKLAKIAKNSNTRVINKRRPTLGSILSGTSKYKTTKDTNVVYSVPCQCGATYIGETSKTLNTRLSQHRTCIRNEDPNNGIAVHVKSTGHNILWDKAFILTRETNWTLRKIKEAIYIEKLQPRMNLYSGYNLKSTWTSFI